MKKLKTMFHHWPVGPAIWKKNNVGFLNKNVVEILRTEKSPQTLISQYPAYT